MSPHAVVSYPNVVVDLSRGSETALSEMSSNTRYGMRLARRRGVVVKHRQALVDMKRFRDLYIDTMLRLGASNYYHFSEAQLNEIARGLGDSCYIFDARLDGATIASEIYFHGADHVYYFLAGSDAAYRDTSAGHIIKLEACRYFGDELGKSALVLGGGIDGADSLYRYKRGFGPNGLRTFRLEWRCEQPKVEEWLIEECRSRDSEWHPRERYLPLYRA